MSAYWNCISKSVTGEAQYSMAKFSISRGGQVAAAAAAGAKQSKVILGQSSVLPGEGKYSLRSCWGGQGKYSVVLPGEGAVQKRLAEYCSRAESASRRLPHSCPTAPHHIQGGFPHTHKYISCNIHILFNTAKKAITVD